MIELSIKLIHRIELDNIRKEKKNKKKRKKEKIFKS